MKTIIAYTILISVIFNTTVSFAASKTWSFTYKPKNKLSFQIKKTAESKEIAFKLAAKECFNQLTQGVYPGESAGLDYIDVCANPKM